jgi:hypothetical protein
VLYETIFGNVDLSVARYLETCLHKGPSILDHRTLARSGRLPIEFLRGCGLPDFLINEAPAFQRNLNRYRSCFISYSSKDQEFVDQLHTDLQSKGVRCWFAPKDLKIGDKFRAVIDEAIRGTEKLLLILSENAISSTWVEKEVETAFEEESRRGQIVLFPIRLDDAVMKTEEAWASDIRRIRNIGDFSSWKEYNKYELAFSQLLRDLQTERSTKQALAKRADRA